LTAEIVRRSHKPRYVWAPEGEEPDWDDLRARGLLPEPGFKVLARRWVVERSIAWICHNRRVEQGLREGFRKWRDFYLRGDEPPDGEAVGPFMRLFRQSLRRFLG
jgi:hypothetical protein